MATDQHEMEALAAGAVSRKLPTASRGRLGRLPSLATWGPIFAFVAIIVLFGILEPGVFLSKGNVLSVLTDQSVLAIMACGLTCVLLTGEFDMSVGAVMSSSAIVSAMLVSAGRPVVLAIVVSVAIGLVVGLINGLILTRFKVPALIVTLAIASILDGFVLAITQGRVIFENIGKDFTDVGRAPVLGVQAPIIYMIVVALVLWAVLKYTVAGRYIHAVGSNRAAARMSGIRVDRYVVLAFVVAGGCAAAAGVIQAARNGAAQPSMGTSFLLPAFSACFLGSATLRRGEFHIPGTMIGVYLIAAGSSGFFILGVPYWVQYIFAGVILLIATTTAGLFVYARKKGKS